MTLRTIMSPLALSAAVLTLVSATPMAPACAQSADSLGQVFFLWGGDKEWGRYPPYRELGYEAMQATSRDFALGTAGAGTGAQHREVFPGEGGQQEPDALVAAGVVPPLHATRGEHQQDDERENAVEKVQRL